MIDPSHVLVDGGVGSVVDVNGTAPARVLDLACAKDCVPAVWPGAIPLARAEAFTIADGIAARRGRRRDGAIACLSVTADQIEGSSA